VRTAPAPKQLRPWQGWHGGCRRHGHRAAFSSLRGPWLSQREEEALPCPHRHLLGGDAQRRAPPAAADPLPLPYLCLRGGTEQDSWPAAGRRPPFPAARAAKPTAGFEPLRWLRAARLPCFSADRNYRASG